MPTVFNHLLYDYIDPRFQSEPLFEAGYASRALIFSRPDDVVQLPGHLRPHLDWIRDHWRRVGLDRLGDIVWDDRIEVLRDFPDWALSVYHWGETVNRVLPNPRLHSTVERLNDKNRFFEFARSLGVPVPATIPFRHGGDRVNDFGRARFPCLLKPAVSAHGNGIEKCSSRAALTTLLEGSFADVSFQLQEILPEDTRYLNVLYECTPAGAVRNTITEQIMEGFSHAGNKCVSGGGSAWAVTDRMAEASWRSGMRGPLGFDLAVLADPGERGKELVLDCNPRFNGASYPVHAAARLGLRYWTHRQYPVGVNRLDKLRIGDLTLNPASGAGVLVLNWGTIGFSEVGILCAAPQAGELALVVEELEGRIADRLRPSVPDAGRHVALSG